LSGKYTVCIVVIGSEITKGIIQDTNSHWIANRVTNMGLEVKRIIAVPDEAPEIAWALKNCLESTSIVFTTGGLGFTSDDITLKAIAETLGLKLVLSIEALEMIKNRLSREPSYQVKAAYLPEGAKPLYNRVGISPGVYLVYHSKHLFVLPGVPSEMKAIFEDHVVPVLSNLVKSYSKRIIIKTRHASEAEVDNRVRDIREKYPWAYIKTHAKNPVEVSILVLAESPRELEERIHLLIEKLRENLEVSSIEYVE